jgi:hypothetical protein
MALTVIKSTGIDTSGNYTVNGMTVSANLVAGNIRTNNLQYANGDPYIFTSNAAGSNTQVQFNTNNAFSASPNFTFDSTTNTLSVTNIIANGSQLTNLNASNIVGSIGSSEQANIANTANSVSGSNVSGQVSNALVAGTVYTNAQPNITSVGTLTDLSITGNTTTGNLRTDNLQYSNGSPYVFTTNAAGSNTQIQFNDGNLFAGSANLTFDKTTNTLSVTNIIANGNQLTNLNASNISGQVANALVAGTVYTNAQPNITSLGTLTDLNVSGNAVIGGNLTVSGNLKYINVETLAIQDPIIELGGGPNNTPLTTNDGKDRGTLLHYYTTQVVDAFMGWDNSNGEFAFGSNVSIASEVVTFNSLGNVRASYFLGNGSQLTGVIATTATTAETVTTNAQPNITSLGTLANLAVDGIANLSNVGNVKITGGTNGQYLQTDGTGNLTWSSVESGSTSNIFNGNTRVDIPTANSNVLISVNDVANIVEISNTGISVSGTGNFTGNLNASNVVIGTGTGGNITGVNQIEANVVTLGGGTGGNITGANVISANTFIGNGSQLTGITAATAGTVTTNAQPNITSVGTLSNLTVTGNTTTGNLRTDNLQYANGSPYVFTTNAAGSNTQIQFNDGNSFAGSANLTFDKTTNTLSVTNLTSTNAINFTSASNVSLGSVSNVKVTGGTNGQYLQTDGAGNLSWSTVTSGSTSNISNGTSNVSIATTNGNVSVGVNGTSNVVVITSTGINVAGTGNFSGNLSASNVVIGTGTGGNITGVDQIEANVVTLGGGTGGNITGANVITANTFIGNGSQLTGITAATAGTVTTNAQPNITSVGTLTSLNVTGNANVGNIGATNAVFTNVSGNGNQLTNLNASNISGQVANALVAGTVYTNAQPNITSVGLLTSLSVGPNSSITLTGTSGFVRANSIQGIDGVNAIFPAYNSVSGAVGIQTNLTVGISGAGSITANGNVTANNFIGNGSQLTGITAATAGTVTTNAQPNITSVGTLTSLTVSGTSILGSNTDVKITGGTTGQLLSTDGTGNLSWASVSGGATITDDTTTNSVYYPVYATSSSGSLTTAGITTTKLQFVPSTGQLTVQDLNTLSDMTLKENTEVINDPFTVLSQLFGVSFTWVDSGKKSYGLLAQMLENVLPELVSTNAQGKKTVNYIPIIAFLIEAVKKQQQDIDELKKR